MTNTKSQERGRSQNRRSSRSDSQSASRITEVSLEKKSKQKRVKSIDKYRSEQSESCSLTSTDRKQSKSKSMLQKLPINDKFFLDLSSLDVLDSEPESSCGSSNKSKFIVEDGKFHSNKLHIIIQLIFYIVLFLSNRSIF